MDLFLHLPRRLLLHLSRRQVLFYGNSTWTSPSIRHGLSPSAGSVALVQEYPRNYCSSSPKESSEESAVVKEDKKTHLSTKVRKIESEWEEDEKRRYERDVPPTEEERHKYWKSRQERSINKALVRTDLFQNLKNKNKETFLMAVEVFAHRDVHARGHVEFIYAALAQMKEFGMHRDLDAYKKIIDVFPKGRFIPVNMFQLELMHFPKQQQCAIDLLEQMEEYGVMPDSELQQMLTNVFGSQSYPMRKASRMLYWMPKFKHLSPWSLPEPLPDSSLELAKLAVQRMTSVDLATKITIYDTQNLDDAVDQTWIVSGQSPEQQKLIESHPSDQPIYVEGAFRVWISRVCINYFILRAEPKPTNNDFKDPDDVSRISTIFDEASALEKIPTVHEQDDGVILGVCATGTSSRDSVVSWIRFLEDENKRLGRDIAVLFTLKSPIGPTDNLEILSLKEMDALRLVSDKNETDHSHSEKDNSSESPQSLDVHPALPSLKQVGIWSESETVFANWPHHNHPEGSTSAKNLRDNQRLAEEVERAVEEKSRSLKDNENTPPDKSKRIS